MNLAQLWAGWCALQTPPSDGSMGCLPNLGGTFGNGMCVQFRAGTNDPMFVDCGKLELCGLGPSICEGAVATGCKASDDFDVATFDAFMTDDTLSGTLVGTVGGNIHFVKD